MEKKPWTEERDKNERRDLDPRRAEGEGRKVPVTRANGGDCSQVGRKGRMG